MSEAPGVGSAAEEAVRLFAAAESWARGKVDQLVDTDHFATGSPACSVCPVCQLVGAARQVRPEAVAHLLDAAASLVAALRSAVVPAEPASGRTGAGVEHIDIRQG